LKYEFGSDKFGLNRKVCYDDDLWQTFGRLRMQKNIALSVLLLVLAGILGCHPSQENGASGPVDTTADPMERLIANRLPAVKGIQKWHEKYGDGLVITTEHYQIYTTLTDTLMLRLLPAFMEAAHEGYQRELPEKIETQNKFEVYLFAQRAQWEQFSDDFAGSEAAVYKQILKGAYCYNGACVAYYIGRSETYSAIGHEGWHQFSGRHFVYRLPSWLDEGIATLFETSTYTNNQWIFTPQINLSRLGGLKRTMLNNNLITLRGLVALNPGEVIGGQDNTMAFYSQSYALVRFLREEGYGKRLSRYNSLLLGGLRGTWPLSEEYRNIASDRNIRLTVRWNAYIAPMLFEKYISEDWERMQAEYVTFCRKMTYHIRLQQETVPLNLDTGR
jgi:hypothetical protein